MGCLVDWEIESLIGAGLLGIDPFDKKLLNPSSLDVRLGDEFGWIDTAGGEPFIDITKPDTFVTTKFKAPGGFILEPNAFILATMLEKVSLPGNVSFKLFGKSSWARAGLDNSSAGAWAEAGFEGSIVLEIKNLTDNRQKLTPGMRCGQLVFYKHERPRIPYNKKESSRYAGQVGLQGSKGV